MENWFHKITDFLNHPLFPIAKWIIGKTSPALRRLINGLDRRKIAIFAKGDNLTSLKDLLKDLKLFSDEDIIAITGMGDTGRAEKATVFLVYWSDWKDDIKAILDKTLDTTPLVVYAPQELGSIPPDAIKALNTKRHCVIANFRGRLLNDIVLSMITTSR